jgi:Rrf2 family protein
MAESCRFAFAVHVMAVLALRRDKLCPSSMLARTVNTNPVVIRRLLLALQKAGLITTARGPTGGARLSRSPRQIRLGDILRAVEERHFFGAHPHRPSQACPVGCQIEAVLEEVFARAARALEKELDGITLDWVLRELAVS